MAFLAGSSPLKQRGVVLLLILVLLPMALLMLLMNLQAVAKLQQLVAVEKAVLNDEGRQQLALHAFEENLAANWQCLLPLDEVNTQHGRAWWEEKACLWSFAGAQYYAIITDLGLNPCLGAHFYRIQLFNAALGQRAIQRVLQSVYAIPQGEGKTCPQDNRFQWGRQHWRLA